MTSQPPFSLLKQGLRAQTKILLVLACVAVLAAINILLVNQQVSLYLFYIPVIIAAWYLPKRDAAGMATLVWVLLMAYDFFMPARVAASLQPQYVWAELAAWGGILVVTSLLVAFLRATAMKRTAELQHALCGLEQAYQGVLEILSKFIQTVDTDTANHSVRVSALAVRIAQTMNLDRQMIEETRVAGMLHDVGKVEVSVNLLRKSASLSAEERAQINKHATGGAAMVASVGGMLSRVADAIECHHERYDGSGLKGLKGEAIPLVARIISIADAYDAMVSDRPYRKGISIVDARHSLTAVSGADFDPQVVQALLVVLDQDDDAASVSAAAYTSQNA